MKKRNYLVFGGDGAPFSGRVDEVGIFNRALSALEITAESYCCRWKWVHILRMDG